jgi:hypothetical protein
MRLAFHVPALVLLALAGTAHGQSLQENAGITAAQRDLLELRTCQAWHGQRIAAFRTEDLGQQGLVRVSFECEPHGQVRNRPLAAIGSCVGKGDDWACDAAGFELDLGTAEDSRPVRMVDVSPDRALELYAFIEAQARKGRRIRSGILEGHLTLLTVDDGATYLATFEFADHANALVIKSRCGGSGCRYRLVHTESYATYRDL